MIGVLGGPELGKTLSRTGPVTLLAYAFLSSLADRPAALLGVILAMHLLVVILVMRLSRQWQPARQSWWLAGMIAALHPIAAGAVGGLASLGMLLAMAFTLAATLFALAFARERSVRYLPPVFLLSILAVGADVSGFLVLPAVLFLGLFAPLEPAPRRWLARVLPTLAAGLGVAAMAAYLWSFGPAAAFWRAAFTAPPAARLMQTIWLVRGAFLPIVPDAVTRWPWLDAAAGAIPAALLVTVTVVQLRRRVSLVVWPALLALTFLAAAVSPDFGARPIAPSNWATIYPTALVLALWLADLWPTPERRAGRIVVMAALLAVLLPQTVLQISEQSARARRVHQMGGELAILLQHTPDGIDVLIPTLPSTASLVEAAYLSANYHGQSAGQVRLRLLMGGRLVVRDSDTPTGESRGLFARLPLDEQKLFIGLDREHDHLIDLTSLIRAKVRLVQDEIAQQRRVPPMPLGDEAVIDAWLAACPKWETLAVQTPSWFLEGLLLRLHPHAGRDAW
jgi:hypothetical protein